MDLRGKSCAGIVTVGFDCFEVGFNCFEVGFDGGLNDGVNVLDRKRKTLVVYWRNIRRRSDVSLFVGFSFAD